MSEKKGYGVIFRDFMKMFMGQISKSFPLKEWQK